MKVFVTGGDGLLGSNVVRQLLTLGHEVRVLVQPGRQPMTLQGLEVELVSGDILNGEELTRLSKGYEIFIHIAALTSVWPIKHPKYYAVNVEGTQKAIEAALHNQVKRFMYVSSGSAIFAAGSKERPGDETGYVDPDSHTLDYLRSKGQAHLIVEQAVKEKGLPAVLLNPTYMLGAYDSKPSSGTMLIKLYEGAMPGTTSGGKNWVYVKDVAYAICAAIDKGRIGESYILGHENLTFTEALSRISKVLGCKAPRFVLPSPVVKLAGNAGSAWGRLTGKDPGLTTPLAEIACQHIYFTSAKAVAELGMPQTPIEVAVEEAFAWFVAHDYIKVPAKDSASVSVPSA